MIVDFDDFCEKNNRLDLLFYLKSQIPEFKANLFTIVGKCSPSFLESVKEISWLDMIPHGWGHDTPRECQNWDYEKSKHYLKEVNKLGLTKGFKAPGWQIPDGMYRALLEEGYWVADQHYNDRRRPKGLEVFYPTAEHFHIQNVCGNGLEESLDQILQLKGDFKLIKALWTDQPSTQGL